MKLDTIYKQTKTGATQEWTIEVVGNKYRTHSCLLYTSPSPRDGLLSRMPSSA